MYYEIYNASSNTCYFSQMLRKLLACNPHFQLLLEAPDLKSYFAPIHQWVPNDKFFPYRDRLQERITGCVKKIYGENIAASVLISLQRAFTADTGGHLALPRTLDRVGRPGSQNYSVNTLIFQGTLLSAAHHADHNNSIHLSMGTGRIPPNNANSAAYFQLGEHVGADSAYIRLISNRWKDTPQVFIPPLDLKSIQTLKKEAILLINKQKYSDFAMDSCQKRVDSIFSIFEKFHSRFSDQIVGAHSYLFSEILHKTGLSQVTIDYEELSWDFLIELLEDTGSLTYTVFSNTNLRKAFLKLFSGIQTGWQENQWPFDRVVEKDGIKKLSSIPLEEEHCPSDFCTFLKEELKARTLIPKGVLQFFIFMIEGGLLPIGGMNQSRYCSNIRDRSVQFLHELGEVTRANAVKALPCSIMNISPAWGMRKGTSNSLLCYSDCLSGELQLDRNHFSSIAKIPGEAALLLGSIPLHEFLLNTRLDLEQENRLFDFLIRQGKVVCL